MHFHYAGHMRGNIRAATF
jgi:hypothetical protein